MEKILRVFKKDTLINLILKCTKDMQILLENLEITKISKVSYLFILFVKCDCNNIFIHLFNVICDNNVYN